MAENQKSGGNNAPIRPDGKAASRIRPPDFIVLTAG